MVTESQHAKAATLRSLHEDGIFVLPNAWDAAVNQPGPGRRRTRLLARM